MKRRSLAALAVAFALSALPAHAHQGIHILDPYVRIIAGSGVVYLLIENHSDQDDTLVAAASDAANTMLMTSAEDASGVMKMTAVPAGFVIKSHDICLLAPAGDHLMLSGVPGTYKDGDTIAVLLTFEKAGQISLTIPVENARRTPPGAGPTPFDAESIAVN
jgi:periplasmic copper chaperone A